MQYTAEVFVYLDPKPARIIYPRHGMTQNINLLIDRVRHDVAIPCTRPWTSIEERSLRGDYRICCFISDTIGHIPKDSDGDVLALFHSDPVAQVRQAFTEGDIHRFCPEDCPVLVHKRTADPAATDFVMYDPTEYATFSAEFRENRERTLQAIIDRDTDIRNHPLRLKLHPSNTCNLRCRMCMQDKGKKVVLGEGYRRELYALMPYLEDLSIFGGEPFACRFTREIIFGEEIRKYPQIHYSTISNGTLLDAKTLEKLKPLRLGLFSFSVDSCSEEVYSQIRIGGSFRETFANIERLAAMRDRSEIRIREIELNFTIQALNVHEIGKFIEYAHSIGVSAGFGMVTGFGELKGRTGEVREHLQEGIETAQRLGDMKTTANLRQLLESMSSYEQSLKKLKMYHSLLPFVDQEKVIYFMRRHPRLKKFLRNTLGF